MLDDSPSRVVVVQASRLHWAAETAASQKKSPPLRVVFLHDSESRATVLPGEVVAHASRLHSAAETAAPQTRSLVES